MNLRVELLHDPEETTWGFRAPALNLVGGGCLSRDEAELHVRDAIAYCPAGGEPDQTAAEVIQLHLEPVVAA